MLRRVCNGPDISDYVRDKLRWAKRFVCGHCRLQLKDDQCATCQVSEDELVHWMCGAFDVFDAVGLWDDQHRHAFSQWVQSPPWIGYGRPFGMM